MSESTPPPLPSVLGLLRRSPGPFLGYTLLIGFGVCTAFCMIGIVAMWVGSSGLLAHALRTAGYSNANPGSVRAGFLTLVLATVIAAAGFAGLAPGHGDPKLALVVAVLAIAVVGAALAPLALAPIAAACGTPGLARSIVRATDLAGTDRVHVLAPLCALIAVGLVAPIPLVASGLISVLVHGERALIGVAILAGTFWMAWVPTSAAMLTLRYLRHQQRNDAPTRIGQAMAPILAAALIGLLALGGSAAIDVGRNAYVHRGIRSVAGLHEEPRDFVLGEARVYPYSGMVVVRNDERVTFPDVRDCRAYTRASEGALVTCSDEQGNPLWIELDRSGALVPSPILERVRIGAWSGGAMLLALLVLALALARLGRLGASLRLLSHPRFEHTGTLRTEASELTFAANDGAHLVRAPRTRIDHAPEHAITHGDAAILLSNEALTPMTFRTAHAPLPSDALIVIGPVEDALARRIAHARKVGFRLAVVTLASLVAAAVTLLFHA